MAPNLSSPNARKSRLSISFEDNFWRRVDQTAGPQECWPWTGACHKDLGYGGCSAPDENGVWRAQLAHRIALFLTTQEWSVRYKTCVRHLCNNPPCCNPAHLRLGSIKDNTADARRAGTLGPKNPMRGEAHISARVTAADVPIIRARMGDGESAASVGRDYGMSGTGARAIWKRKTWRHVA